MFNATYVRAILNMQGEQPYVPALDHIQVDRYIGIPTHMPDSCRPNQNIDAFDYLFLHRIRYVRTYVRTYVCSYYSLRLYVCM